jgi:hypothetical protein
MKRLIILLLISFCSTPSSVVNENDVMQITDTENTTENTTEKILTYKNELGEFVEEDLTNKNTLVVFWADY